MPSKVRAELRELDIELDLDLYLPLPSGKREIKAQTLVVRYVNVGKSHEDVDMWYVAEAAVYGQIRSTVTGGLTASTSKVSYETPEKTLPKVLWDEAVTHTPGKVWLVTK